jgi:5-methylcytosine-specific restriction endonuclease McrA
MYISKKDRELIKNKYQGKCAYTGTDLKEDWQIDHIKPIIRNLYTSGAMFEKDHTLNNMVPCQKIVNHYKGSLDLESFRNWFLGELHLRLKKLPRNPKTAKSIKRKQYLLEIANLFGITEDKPFNREFYFETFNH